MESCCGVEKKEGNWIFKGEVDTLWKNFETMIRSFFFCLSPFTIRDKSKD